MSDRSCVGDLLLVVDTVTSLIGLTILGFALYVYIQYSQWSVILSSTGSSVIYYGLGVGAGLFLLGIWGCVASQRRHKMMQLIYFVLVFACVCASIAAAVVLSTYGGKLNGLLPGAAGQTLSDTVTLSFNNAILSTYVACCYGGCNGGGQSCPNTAAIEPYYDGYLSAPCNTTAPGTPTISTICTPATACASNATTQGCFSTAAYPTTQIDQSTCRAFGDLHYQSAPLINFDVLNSAQLTYTGTTVKSCGGGDPTTYVQNVAGYVQTIYTPLYQATAAFAGLQAVNFVLALILTCCVRDDRK